MNWKSLVKDAVSTAKSIAHGTLAKLGYDGDIAKLVDETTDALEPPLVAYAVAHRLPPAMAQKAIHAALDAIDNAAAGLIQARK